MEKREKKKAAGEKGEGCTIELKPNAQRETEHQKAERQEGERKHHKEDN